MTDDIVTRLRKGCASSHLPDLRCSVFYDGGCMPCQAADEIERWRTIADDLAKIVWEAGCNAYPSYKRYVEAKRATNE